MTSPTERVIALLEEVSQTGTDRWMALCPAHQDGTASLSIREGDDGRVLLHCFVGCGASEVVDALGLNMYDLFMIVLVGCWFDAFLWTGVRRAEGPPRPPCCSTL